ncbi:hypothetical protein SapgrDRAFT_2187 [Saprospira grandis DSM 2844]|uniref:Bacterial membrane protein YfhO n=1 Tax=Saprospira grandis DSM 2844 TaxID=694433 RepID=J1I648_9BACT|nr:hypothetical protein [Saprospira grandis]EJF53863.1 hypothetical protein SapgrDRAFT_2187 [Saprospira grandis DSM 2844]
MKITNALSHFAIVAILLFAAILYFKPVALDNKSLPESDNSQARGMQAEIQKYKKAEGDAPLWTDQVFVGMPSYQIYGEYNNNVIQKLFLYVVRLGTPVNTPHIILFMMMLLAYLSLIMFGVNKWMAAVGGLAFGLMTNNLVLFEAGHSTKLHAMTYMAPILAAATMALRGKRMLLGASLMGFFLAGQISANHLQITYYTFMMLAFIGGAFLVNALLKREQLMTVVKGGSLLIIAAALAVGANLSALWTTYEYSKETIRGKSELTAYTLNESDARTLAQEGMPAEKIAQLQQARILNEPIKTETIFINRLKNVIGPDYVNANKERILALASSQQQDGLNKEYIFGWSYGKMETFTLLVPHFYGGANGMYFADDQSKSGIQLSKESATGKVIQKMMRNVQDPNQSQQIANQLLQMSTQYWGAQPFTSGPVYFGAVICLLLILGLFLAEGPLRWGLGLALLFLTVLAWGDNFKAFNYFMVDNFPMYNKFRAVSMALSAAQVLAALLAILGLQGFFNLEDTAKREKLLYLATGITAGLAAFALVYSFVGDLSAPNDARLEAMVAQAPQWAEYLEALKEDRASLMRSDALRSLVFVLLAAGSLWAFNRGYFKEKLIAVAILGLLSLVDLVGVDLNYVNKESFQRKKDVASAPPMTKADQQVLSDKDPHFRVFDLIAGARRGGSPSNSFANSEGAYFHKVIGGYHAAKPILLQEMVEGYFTNNEILTDKRHLIEMLNVKYVMQSPENAVQIGNLGNAWLVDQVKQLEDADAVYTALATFNPRVEAITTKANAAYLDGLANTASSGDYIRLKSYHPEKLVYESQTQNERFAVFSEIYYPASKGWHLYIDGQRADQDFIKVNYLLRGARIPAGQHKIEMVFEPNSYYTGETLALISSLLILLALLGTGFLAYRQAQLKAEESLI